MKTNSLPYFTLLACGSLALAGCAANDMAESGAGRQALSCVGSSCPDPDDAPTDSEVQGVQDDLDCSASKRVALIAAEDADLVQVRACFYLTGGEIQYPAVGDAYAVVLDAAGEELDVMALPDAAKTWLQNGIGGNLWFFDTAYLPGAERVDLFLRGHSTEQYTRIASTEVPGAYDSDSFDYVAPDDEPTEPFVPHLELGADDAVFERY